MEEPQRFETEWWLVQLPSGWSAHAEDHGASFSRRPAVGTLQISTARKPDENVTDSEVLEFIDDHRELRPTEIGSLSGYSDFHADKTLAKYSWWLRYRRLMVFVTYFVPTGSKDLEIADVRSILGSLTLKSEASD